MKTATRLFTLGVLMLCVGLMQANAQGRGREHGGGNGRGHHDNGHHNDHRNNDNHDNHYAHHDRHDHHPPVQYVYHRAHRDVYYHPAPPPRVVVVHHAPVRPRYVYYRDYNVYYDCHRSVYISYSGRGWAVSAALPVCLNRVDVRRANRVSVEYYNDDFSGYLDGGAPVVYGDVYTD